MRRRLLRAPGDRGPRRVYGLAVAALALAATLIAFGGDRPAARADAATGSCVKHTKRVVVHVERHGKRARVVRLKHFWTCEEAPAAAPTTPAPPAAMPMTPALPEPSASMPMPNPPVEAPSTPPATPQPPVTEPEPQANAVRVTATERGLEAGHPYTYVPSRPTVHAGQLTVQLVNEGQDPHDLYMQRVGPHDEAEGEVIKVTEMTKPGAQTTKSVEVQPGAYRLWCSYAMHAMEGMETHIAVTAE